MRVEKPSPGKHQTLKVPSKAKVATPDRGPPKASQEPSQETTVKHFLHAESEKTAEPVPDHAAEVQRLKMHLHNIQKNGDVWSSQEAAIALRPKDENESK